MSCRPLGSREWCVSSAEPSESVLRLAGAEGDPIGSPHLALAQPILHSCGVLPSYGKGWQRRTWFPAERLPLWMTLALEITKLFTKLIGKSADELITIFALEVGRYQVRIHSKRWRPGISDIQGRVAGLPDFGVRIVLQYFG